MIYMIYTTHTHMTQVKNGNCLCSSFQNEMIDSVLYLYV